jgi:BirA family biotin operon repressor/biotin-[acetyl-CoA-carboxylase] ligase
MIIGSEIIFMENLPSTNTYASQILRSKKVKEGMIICTNYQSAGRGYAGNGWESEDGKNLLFSILLFPTFIDPANQFIISMAISLGICDFLERHIPVCTVKWPNDIYVSNDKIAGILIENTIMGNMLEDSIAGIGLNINQVKFLSKAPNPVSLKTITGKEYDLRELLTELASSLDKRYKQILSEKSEQLKEEYISKLYRLNQWAGFRDHTGIFTGRILSVSENGKLLVETKSGSRNEYSFKEVEFIILNDSLFMEQTKNS